MFNRLRIRPLTLLLSLLLIALPSVAGTSGSSPGRSDTGKTPSGSAKKDTSSATSRMGSASFAPSNTARTTTTGERVRAPESVNPQLKTYVPRINRLEPVTNTRERFPQPENDRPIVWVQASEDDPAKTAAEGPLKTSDLEQLLERGEVLVKQKSYGQDEEEDRVVFCSREIYEYHLDRDCPMLDGTTPTPRRLKFAKSGRYTECSACRKRHR